MFSQVNYILKVRTANLSKAISSTRLSWVDHARGLAIMLVVYRHAVVGMQRSGLQVSSLMFNMQEVFYNFRMPVFFVLSGIFVAGSLRKKSRTAVFKDRTFTILYPYLLWASITILAQLFFSQFTNSKRSWTDLAAIITQPRKIDHLWYLFALFNTSVLYLLLSKLIRNKLLHAVLAVVLNLISISSYFQGNSLVADTLYFYCYFFSGTVVSGLLLNKEKREYFLKTSRLKWMLPLFVVGQWFWFTHRQQEDIYMPLFLLINLVACYFVYIIAFRIASSDKTEWLSYLGRHSLYIYVLHVFFTSAIRNLILHFNASVNPWILLFACWIGGLSIPVLLFVLLRNFGFEKLFSLKQKATA